MKELKIKDCHDNEINFREARMYPEKGSLFIAFNYTKGVYLKPAQERELYDFLALRADEPAKEAPQDNRDIQLTPEEISAEISAIKKMLDRKVELEPETREPTVNHVPPRITDEMVSALDGTVVGLEDLEPQQEPFVWDGPGVYKMRNGELVTIATGTAHNQHYPLRGYRGGIGECWTVEGEHDSSGKLSGYSLIGTRIPDCKIGGVK